MMHRGRLIISTLLGAVVSGTYWFAFFWVAYGLTAGDYRPGSEPSDQYLDVKAFLVITGGPILYAIGAWFWRRAEARFVATGRR